MAPWNWKKKDRLVHIHAMYTYIWHYISRTGMIFLCSIFSALFAKASLQANSSRNRWSCCMSTCSCIKRRAKQLLCAVVKCIKAKYAISELSLLRTLLIKHFLIPSEGIGCRCNWQHYKFVSSWRQADFHAFTSSAVKMYWDGKPDVALRALSLLSWIKRCLTVPFAI